MKVYWWRKFEVWMLYQSIMSLGLDTVFKGSTLSRFNKAKEVLFCGMNP